MNKMCLGAFALTARGLYSLAEGMEGNYREVRGRRAQHLRRLQKNCPDRALAVHLMREYVRSCKFAGCTTDARYLEALGLKVPAAEK